MHERLQSLSRTARVGVVAALALGMTAAAADDRLPRFVDPADGTFDASDWLLEHKGFLPVPIAGRRAQPPGTASRRGT